jgi:predicted membrane metal-binding protein
MHHIANIKTLDPLITVLSKNLFHTPFQVLHFSYLLFFSVLLSLPLIVRIKLPLRLNYCKFQEVAFENS